MSWVNAIIAECHRVSSTARPSNKQIKVRHDMKHTLGSSGYLPRLKGHLPQRCYPEIFLRLTHSCLGLPRLFLSKAQRHKLFQRFSKPCHAAPKVYLPGQHFHLPWHSVSTNELHCEDSAQNINTYWAGQVRVLLCLPTCRFFCQIHLQRGKWLCCILETLSMMKSIKSEMWLYMNIPAEIDKMMHLFTKCLLCLPLHFGNKPSDCFQVMNTQHKHDDAQTQGMACIEDMPTTDWQHMSLHSYRMHDCILAGLREIKTGRFMSVVDSR